MTIGRQTLASLLLRAATGEETLSGVAEHLRAAIAGGRPELQYGADPVSTAVLDIDAALADAEGCRRLCAFLGALLSSRIGDEDIVELMSFFRAHDQWAVALQRYGSGAMPRASFLSFVRSRAVSRRLAARLMAMTAEDAAVMHTFLADADDKSATDLIVQMEGWLQEPLEA